MLSANGAAQIESVPERAATAVAHHDGTRRGTARLKARDRRGTVRARPCGFIGQRRERDGQDRGSPFSPAPRDPPYKGSP
jgi:hypothetical protein